MVDSEMTNTACLPVLLPYTASARPLAEAAVCPSPVVSTVQGTDRAAVRAF